MEGSSIYLKCPGCQGQTLLQHVGPTYRCAACGFDYGEFAKDRARFEGFLVERLREGPMGQLGALALHQRVSGLGAQQSVAAIRAIAEQNGVKLPEPADPKVFVRRILIALGCVVLVIIAMVLYAILG